MKKELSLQEKKDIEKSILDFVDSVCKEHNISYSLAYGTLLGAVRHKGFIPWDDDIDIMLLRPEYEKLIRVLRECNHPRYKVIDHKDKGYYYTFAKVVDTYTEVEEKNVLSNDKMGLWIDLFPLDGTIRKNNHIRKFFFHIIERCRAASVNVTFPKNKYSRLMYVPWLICSTIGYKFFLQKELKYAQRYLVSECDYVEFVPEPSKEPFMKDSFSKMVSVEFEGSHYPAIHNYKDFLKSCYGDYMELPPLEKRIPHGMKAILKQNDMQNLKG